MHPQIHNVYLRPTPLQYPLYLMLVQLSGSSPTPPLAPPHPAPFVCKYYSVDHMPPHAATIGKPASCICQIFIYLTLSIGQATAHRYHSMPGPFSCSISFIRKKQY